MKKLWVLMLTCSPAAATAAPIYLDCSLPPGAWSFAMDEQEGSVQWSVAGTDLSGIAPAAFRPDKVTFRVMSATFEISRVNLSLKQSLLDGTVRSSRCRLPAKPKRAF
jgi:hypothetical protein